MACSYQLLKCSDYKTIKTVNNAFVQYGDSCPSSGLSKGLKCYIMSNANNNKRHQDEKT